MKSVFPEFFVNKKRINFNDLDDSILVVLDANILLELYRSSSKLRDELIQSINLVKNNLWMPYQVGFEFNRNRKILMHKIANDKEKFEITLNNGIINTIDEFIEEFKKKYKLFEELIDINSSKIIDFKNEVENKVRIIGEEIKSDQQVDFLALIEEIYMDKIEDNSLYDYDAWVSEADERYKIKQPPGYEDYKKKKDDFYFIKGKRVSGAYGDFFMWKEILLKAKEAHIKEVVFITNDVKEDWFFETTGRKIGARVELIEEMIRESNANFRIFTSSSFLFHTLSEEEYLIIENEAKNSEVTKVNYDAIRNNNSLGDININDYQFNVRSYLKNNKVFHGIDKNSIDSMMINFEKKAFDFRIKLFNSTNKYTNNNYSQELQGFFEDIFNEHKTLIMKYEDLQNDFKNENVIYNDNYFKNSLETLLSDMDTLFYRLEYFTEIIQKKY